MKPTEISPHRSAYESDVSFVMSDSHHLILQLVEVPTPRRYHFTYDRSTRFHSKRLRFASQDAATNNCVTERDHGTLPSATRGFEVEITNMFFSSKIFFSNSIISLATKSYPLRHNDARIRLKVEFTSLKIPTLAQKNCFETSTSMQVCACISQGGLKLKLRIRTRDYSLLCSYVPDPSEFVGGNSSK